MEMEIRQEVSVIEDLISGILECMNIDFDYPINLGNDKEFSLNELARYL